MHEINVQDKRARQHFKTLLLVYFIIQNYLVRREKYVFHCEGGKYRKYPKNKFPVLVM